MALIADQPRIYNEGDPQYIKVQALKTFLEREEHKEFLLCNNLIALYGEWGSGKSSVLKTLEKNIDIKNFTPLIFEAWKYEKDDNLAFSLLEFILTKLSLKEKKLSLLNKLKTYSKKITINELKNKLRTYSSGVTVKPPCIDIDFNKLLKQSLYLETEEFIKKLQKEIDLIRVDKKILVMIDDLDRCDDENITNLLSALKLMFSIENVIFICGIDKEAVIKTLERKYQNHNKAEEYLEKIFPISFNVLKYSNFDYGEDETSADDSKGYFSELKKLILEGAEITNPRKFNKAINKYNFLIKVIDRKKIIDNFFIDFKIKTKIEVVIEQCLNADENTKKMISEMGGIKDEIEIVNEIDKKNKIQMESSAQLKVLEEYFDIIIKLYIFIKVILLESYGIKNIFILEKVPNLEDPIVTFFNIINIYSVFDTMSFPEELSEEHLKMKKILKKIDKKSIMNGDMETHEALVNFTHLKTNYQEVLKLILDQEIEKYY